MSNTFLVVPTIRDLDFLNDWQDQLVDMTIIVCEDHPQPQISVPKVGKKIIRVAWDTIDKELGKDSWIIPRKVSAIRNYGFLLAYQEGADAIITLDDDCFPVAGHPLQLHLENLSLRVPKNWTNTFPDARHMYTRGMPYLNREEQPVMVSHGLWSNVLDHDGPTHLQNLSFKSEFAEHFVQIIPSGAYYPMCSMNLAFNREVTSIMYFPLMGEDAHGTRWGYDRFDDIWAGIFSKKIMDHLGYGVVNGAPFVEHQKASNPFTNLKKEASGIELNERLWKAVDAVRLTASTPAACYQELATSLTLTHDNDAEAAYFTSLKEAMNIWAAFFLP